MTRKPKLQRSTVSDGQDTSPFVLLSTELQHYHLHEPQLVYPGKKGAGSKMGLVLPFVRGLRLSAKLIYAMRQRLTDYNVQIHWGHVQEDNRSIFSPECDIILHQDGQADRWNGHDNDSGCVMDFRFIRVKNVKAVVSCKSLVTSVDEDFAKALKKEFGINHVFLFGEAVHSKDKKRVIKEAKKCGYKGFWYLYEITDDDQRKTDSALFLNFLQNMKRLLTLKSSPASGPKKMHKRLTGKKRQK